MASYICSELKITNSCEKNSYYFIILIKLLGNLANPLSLVHYMSVEWTGFVFFLSFPV